MIEHIEDILVQMLKKNFKQRPSLDTVYQKFITIK